jgi:hypothetical protein
MAFFLCFGGFLDLCFLWQVNIARNETGYLCHLTGYIQEATKDHLWVHVGPAVRGRVLQLEASDDPDVVMNIPAHFHEGQAVACNVARVDAAKACANRLDADWTPRGLVFCVAGRCITTALHASVSWF